MHADAAVLGGVIILISGRDADHLAFDIRRDRDESIGRVTVADKFVQRADAGDVQSRRTREPGTGRSFGLGGHIEAGFGFEEIDELRKQLEPRFVFQFVDPVDDVSNFTPRSTDSRTICRIVARFDPAFRQQTDGEVTVAAPS